MKRLLIVLLITGLGVAAVVTSPAQIETGTSKGVIGVKIAVPEFQAAAGDAKCRRA